MKKKKKKIYILVGVVCLIAAIILVWQLGRRFYAPAALTESEAFTVSGQTVSDTLQTDTENDSDVSADTENGTSEAEAYVSPIDFAGLQEVNSDIYAWILIENTNIDYPVVQHPTDNTYYMTHNSDGNYSANGSVYSELYNSKDFTDPVTVLYGHHMSSGAIFGNLQSYYSDATFFADNAPIKIYTPDALLEYDVFAAVAYDNTHLLYNNDFTVSDTFTSFFQGVMNIRTIGSQVDEEKAPDLGDNVLILSTCLAGNNTRRFLVMGKLITE